MNDLFEAPKVVENKNHSLFVEKYRPLDLNNYICEEYVKTSLQQFIEKQDIPHLLFYNSFPGTGKTSAAKILVKNISCDYLYLNASDENGIDIVRTKIKGFASSQGFSNLKIIILDEFDQFTAEAQSALRNLIETFSLHTRFILTCNYVEKIIPPIVSRCQTFKIDSPTKKEVALLVTSIMDKEKIKYTAEDVAYVVNNYYPDMRKIINYVQQSTIDNTLTINRHDTYDSDGKAKIVELLKDASSSCFNEIRQVVADADIRFYEDYYKYLFDNVSEYSRGKDVSIILILAEYLYQSSLVVDKEITFMACIARILNEIK